ncbi:MAG: hypothetical protein ABIN91_17540 [Mucilaginibacter sp.]|uniref:hypothetical protein n=1 Tax=Mucilaginibacter sp. TaxID=1882438 RepID=UPI003267B654
MKYIGHIKKFDKYFDSKELSEMFVEKNVDQELRSSVIKYLLAGNFLTGWMSFLRDDDGTPIGNNDYFTDGTYIWPRYYIYYLNKFKNLEMNVDFISHVKNYNFIIPELSKDQLSKLDREWHEEIKRFQKLKS